MTKFKNKPCAYCGNTTSPREKGHVIPLCMYPSDTAVAVQRRTVPECAECKKIWQDAENQFRNIIVIAGTPNSAVLEQWEGPIRRSLNKPGGARTLANLLVQMVPVDTDAGPGHMVFPARDPDVMLVVRKIVRGLCAYHRLGSAIPDERVWVDVLKYRIPPGLMQDLTMFDIGANLLVYGYWLAEDDDENNIRSVWYLKFYEERVFIAGIFKDALPLSMCVTD